MSYFLNDRSFLFGFSGYLILSLVVVYPLLYGYCASRWGLRRYFAVGAFFRSSL